MGYMQYEVTTQFGQKIQAGYGVPDTCNDNACTVEIDRGLDFLCGDTPGGDEFGCGGYFCYSHLCLGPDEIRGGLCKSCQEAYEKNRKEEEEDAA